MFKFINWVLGRRVPSKELYKFYCAWLAWAESGGESHPIFMRWCGLCHNLSKYSRFNEGLYEELKKEFRSKYLSTSYPFGERMYSKQSVEERLHTDPNRLAWVRERIAVYEKYHKK